MLDEYCGTLPGADGRGTNRGPKLERMLPPKMVKRLERAGKVGEALLALSVAAPRANLGAKSRGPGLDADELLTRGRLGPSEAEPPSNPITASARALTSDGVGSEFGSLVLVSSFGIAGAGWLRFRRRHIS